MNDGHGDTFERTNDYINEHVNYTILFFRVQQERMMMLYEESERIWKCC